ncbi:MAG TPA: toll/interleukin-1 receptor domain-containing protein, partial [Ideonella sp.]|nr:toll/interleukin-1 receptor domain-containing protein [Ideonella sp.]
MPSVFLSYRRVDGDYALLLHAWLTERFGAEEVFWDRDDIEAGQDFRRVLSQQLRDCRALIALVGPGWSASEWVQKEIATALRRKILVLPVLVGAAPNLDEDGLPKAIRAIASLQSLQTADLRFRAQLLDALARVMPAPARRGASRASGSSGSPARDARTGRLAALLLEQSDRLQESALDLLLRGDLDAAL